MNRSLKRRIWLLIILLIIPVNIAYGYGEVDGGTEAEDNGGDESAGSGSGTGGSGSGANGQFGHGSKYPYYKDGTKGYRYNYNDNVTTNTRLEYELLDMKKNSIIPSDISSMKKDAIISGTWVGVYVADKNWATWNVTNITIEEVKKKYTCQYKSRTVWDEKYNGICIEKSCKGRWVPFSEKAVLGKCYVPYQRTIDGPTKTLELDYYDERGCPKYLGEHELSSQEDDEEYKPSDGGNAGEKIRNMIYENAKNKAINSVAKRPHRKVEYYTDDKEPKRKAIKGKKIKEELIDNRSSGSYTEYYAYYPEKVCMNLKTSKVTYDDCIVDKKNGIVEIKNDTAYIKELNKDIVYWHYFTPLKLKTQESISIMINSGSKKETSSMCHSIMEKNSNYINHIIPIEGAFKNDYARLKKNSDDWRIAKKGCIYATTIDIPVIQKFYNEEINDKETNFKGFTFYYRPININNPFPNGIENNSFWKDWDGKNPNLKESFKEVTYSTNINTEEIRKYNKETPYTDWSNMNVNGTSGNIIGMNEYIPSDNINPNLKGNITRKSAYNGYHLGCGPDNKDWSECQ